MMSLLNISIDDVSPHPESSIKVLENCFRVIDEFSDVKFTLFVPAAYWRSIAPHDTAEPLALEKYPEFCDVLRSLPTQNFEIGFHGLHHGIPNRSNNDEFRYANADLARSLFERMFWHVDKAGLSDVFKPIFRPPAWRLSPDSFDVASSMGIRTLALSPKDYAQEVYQGRDKLFPRVVYYNVNPPFDPLALFPKTEIVYHACEWDKNYLSIEQTTSLLEFLRINEPHTKFEFIEGLI